MSDTEQSPAHPNSSDEEGNPDEVTVMEGCEHSSNTLSQQQLATIMSALAGIKQSVVELHEATCQSQKDIVDLRKRIETDTANTLNQQSSSVITAAGPLPAPSQSTSLYSMLAPQSQILPSLQPLSAYAPQRQSLAQPSNNIQQGQSLQLSTVALPIQSSQYILQGQSLQSSSANAPQLQTSAQPSSHILQGQSLQSSSANAPQLQTSAQPSSHILQGQSLQSSSASASQLYASAQQSSHIQQGQSLPSSSSNSLQQPAATMFHPSSTNLLQNPSPAPSAMYIEGFGKLYPLPTFDGNPEDWPLFRASYVDSTVEFRYTNRQNLIRLQKALQGSAKNVVSSLLIFPENVPLVMEELQFNFGRPELLIKVQMQKVNEFPTIYEGRLEQVLDLCNRVRNMVAFFKSANCDHHLLNPMLLDSLVLKLPASKQFEWSRHAATVSPYPTVQTFAEWLGELARVISVMPSTLSVSRNHQTASTSRQAGNVSNRNPNVSRRVLLGTNQQNRSQQESSCVKCNQHHTLSECQQFKALNIRRRWELVKSKNLCFYCMQRGHGLAKCQRKRECGIDGCRRMHNQLLHQQAGEVAPTTQQISASNNSNDHLLTCHQSKQSICLFKILPVMLMGPKCHKKVYAIFDEGSSVTLLEESIANELGAKGRSEPLSLQWYNQNQILEDSRVINLDVKGMQSQSSHQLKNVRTINNLDLPLQTFVANQYAHLQGLPIASYCHAKPSLLIGLDNSHLNIVEKTLVGGPHDPIAVATKLGWEAYGPVPLRETSTQCLHVCKVPTTKHLHQLVDEYLSLESFGIKIPDCPLESTEVTRARNILQSTTRNIGQRYEVGLLWSEDKVVLPHSYEMAKRRLLNLEAKMAKDQQYAEAYKAAMQKYIDKNYARLMSMTEADIEGPTTWYLPHFGVINPHKPNKLRVVFDAAATVNNVSLNSYLLKGPEQARPLMSIIFKFRQRTIAVAGDIEEMFSQVKIREADINSQRFLWRDGGPEDPIQVYVMTSMFFGAACSPCCAEYVKNTNAAQFHDTMPRGEKIVIENTYVDDLVVSFDSPEEAKEVIGEAIAINPSAGFNLRNFVTNCKSLQQLLNKNAPVPSNVVNMEHQPKTDKILGMYWNSTNDTLEFHFRFQKIPREVIDCERSPTKRELLGLAMAIYDPFGLISNVTIGVKLILQETWRQNLDWDDQLLPPLSTQWEAWWKSFQRVRNFAIPRCYSPLYSSAKDLQLHLFVDASDAAYAAVAYLRILSGSHTHIAFVASKAKCAPKKATTVPRLELQAAVLGNRLRSSIEGCLDRKITSVTFWSDSQTVLHWIRSTKRDFKQFVASRISEILASTTPSQWRWVPSALNVADDATKVKSQSAYDPDGNWSRGPDFLHADEEYWPAEPPTITMDNIEEEGVKRTLIVQSSQDVVDVSKYSSFTRLLRVVAWMQRFIYNLKHTPRLRGELVPSELIASEQYICRKVQSEVYATEINILKANKCLPRSSPLFQLTPKLDSNGILRISGRIDAAYCLPESARSPIILPQRHHLSFIVVDYFHQRNHHQNSKLTINEIRQQFWVPHAHALLKRVEKQCPVCVRTRAKPAAPLMGQLPPDRVTPYVRPFSYTGIDYCGPFHVAVGRRREKRWIALFTCLTTRAIHLEVATDLSTDAFLICLRNFVNRRGVPVRIRSDNGTNFIGAQHEMKREERLFDFETIMSETSKDKIEWKFSCPANPAEGGCWERLIQCVKRILHRVLREEAPRLETFRSVVIEAENIVNSRPLTDIPLSPQSPEPLTPNHFILGCCNSTQTPSDADENVCLRKQWKIAQNLKDRLWKRWIHEYLPQLLTRSKWHKETTPLQPGQLVLICDPQLPRGQWQTGRIVEVIASKDGQVRSARVRTGTSTIRRPASKLAALEFVNPHQDSPGGGMSATPMSQYKDGDGNSR